MIMFLENNDYFKNSADLYAVMVRFGFDFSLIGSQYLYEMLSEAELDASVLRRKSLQTSMVLADKHSVKIKTFNRDIRWAIAKAFNHGVLKLVPNFKELRKPPSTKEVLAWLYSYYIEQFTVNE